MKPVKYAQSIHCPACEGSVKMTGGRVLAPKGKTPLQVEINYVCVGCGQRGSAVREEQCLPYSEREFCQEKGLLDFAGQAKGKGVYLDLRSRK
ncbi:MAG TPA: hypothetical protein VJ873_03140 [bacterium]|nr:hypothetical protein [bacterium]